MRITFYAAKRDLTLRERALDFADAPRLFAGLIATVQDERVDYPEARYITGGFLDGRLVVVVWTPTDGGRRIISMRHAHEREARKWRQRMG